MTISSRRHSARISASRFYGPFCLCTDGARLPRPAHTREHACTSAGNGPRGRSRRCRRHHLWDVSRRPGAGLRENHREDLMTRLFARLDRINTSVSLTVRESYCPNLIRKRHFSEDRGIRRRRKLYNLLAPRSQEQFELESVINY